MSYALHDSHGHVCDLAGTCSRVLDWLSDFEHDPIIAAFLTDGVTGHPQTLASLIEGFLQSRPPASPVVADAASAWVKGLRQARGFAELIQ